MRFPMPKMLLVSHNWMLPLTTILLALCILCPQAVRGYDSGLKSASFLSPMFEMRPGSVVNRFYYNIKFPRGHIALKSFNAEVVDEAGRPVPLHETYLHHWAIVRSYQRQHVVVPETFQSFQNSDFQMFGKSDLIVVGNSGICQGNSLAQYFGLGSETRRTATFVPDPYGIEVGNPAEIPIGYEERWVLNVHGIDTRGVEDRLGCTECRCDLYNVTHDEYGRPISPDYEGGLRCCYDKTQCKLKDGFESATRNLFLKYTVEWVGWDDSVVPVKIYIFDVTDAWGGLNGSTSHGGRHNCRVEYEIEPCSAAAMTGDCCDDVKRLSLTMQNGGYLIYGVSHQHSGGTGSALYGEDGRLICASVPVYGIGNEAGNETGYIVGMSTCYPQPGTVQISDGETLILESNYSSSSKHTGVMGLFYILLADQLPKPVSFLQAPVQVVHGSVKLASHVLGVALVGAAVAVVAVAAGILLRNGGGDVYDSL